MSALLLVLACSRPDPELVAQRDAIAVWRTGVEALEAGEHDRAVERFRQAQVLRPRDGLLVAWEAQAHARSGDLELAVESVERGLELQPGMAEARYNLAAWLARSGELERAGTELRRALEGGASSPHLAAADPDFSAHLDSPALAFLPRAALEAALSLPEGSVFLGSQARIRLVVSGSDSPRIQAAVHGPVELVSATADVVGVGVEARVSVDWTVVVRGAGDVAVGPVSVAAGDRERELPVERFAAVGPPDRAPVAGASTTLPTPEQLAADLGSPGAAGGAGELRVRASSAQRVTVLPEAGREQRFEQRVGGRATTVVRRWVDLAPGEYTVTVKDPGKVALEQTVKVTAAERPPG